MYIANILLIIINLPLIPFIVQFLRLPYYILYIVIIAVTAVGVYSVDNSAFDLLMMGFFGLVGYVFKKLDYPLAPCVLAVILGPMVERALRQSLVMSTGSYDIFIMRPISGVLLALALLTLFAPLIQQAFANRSRRKSFSESGEDQQN
jgi:putative tricarboxylic transport membrane protein